MSATVAFLGLGRMGGPMAANLVRAGYTVVGHDPAREAREQAERNGVRVVDEGARAVEAADVVLTMLPSGEHVVRCRSELSRAAPAGTLFVDCSTIDVDSAREVAAISAERGHLAADAPVSGGVVGAGSGTLTFMVGGEAEAFEAAEPVLGAMGSRAVHCGPSGTGQATKICNNLILGVSMIAVSEAFVLGERLGLSEQAFFDVASTATGQCWALTSNCPVPGPVATSPANRGYAPGFTSGLMRKDLGLAQQAARSVGMDTVLAHEAAALYERFVDADGPGRDFSAIIEAVREGGLGGGRAEGRG